MGKPGGSGHGDIIDNIETKRYGKEQRQRDKDRGRGYRIRGTLYSDSPVAAPPRDGGGRDTGEGGEDQQTGVPDPGRLHRAVPCGEGARPECDPRRREGVLGCGLRRDSRPDELRQQAELLRHHARGGGHRPCAEGQPGCCDGDQVDGSGRLHRLGEGEVLVPGEAVRRDDEGRDPEDHLRAGVPAGVEGAVRQPLPEQDHSRVRQGGRQARGGGPHLRVPDQGGFAEGGRACSFYG